ncbi:MAG: hypothetical protein M1822_002277 [Bathelium mastoideum]|nr:MAG: hypothetical protein M1822_002277 [Bathelium mastoideum]
MGLPWSWAHPIWVTAVVAPFVTFIFLALRLYSRGIITRSLALNDYIAGATMIFIICYSVTIAIATYHGMGQHVWTYTPELSAQYYYWLGVASEFYVLSLAGYKTALLLLYLQLFKVNNRFRWACYITLFYTNGYLFCNFITEFLGCNPPAKTYNKELPGHCINTIAANISYGVGHMSSDLIIAILPLPMVWRLQLKSKKEKVGISLVLTSGFLAWAVACARFIVSTYDMVSHDRTWYAGIGFMLSVLEINTGLICGCTPAMKPLFHSLRDQSQKWSERYGSHKNSSSGRTGSTDSRPIKTADSFPQMAPKDSHSSNSLHHQSSTDRLAYGYQQESHEKYPASGESYNMI